MNLRQKWTQSFEMQSNGRYFGIFEMENGSIYICYIDVYVSLYTVSKELNF